MISRFSNKIVLFRTAFVALFVVIAMLPVAKAERQLVAPNMELDADLLEQLLTTNLAAYIGDWKTSYQAAIGALKKTNDYRLAELAAAIAIRYGDFTEVEQASKIWLDFDKDNFEAKDTYLIALVANQKTDRALAYFDLHYTQGSLEQRIKKLAGILVRQPYNEAAISIARQLFSKYPDSAQAHLSMAYVAEYFEQPELAEDWIEQALILKPDWELAAQMKVQLLSRQQKFDERAAFVSEYVKKHPKAAEMHINYALELSQKNKASEALVVMQKVIKLQPESSQAHVYAATIAQFNEQPKLAKKYYQTALSLDDSNDKVRMILAVYASEEENYKKAIKYYQQVQNPEFLFEAQLNLAVNTAQAKDLSASLEVFRTIEPNTGEEYLQMTLTRHWLLMDEKKYQQAYAELNESLIYLKDDVQLLYARALVAAELDLINVVEADLRFIIEQDESHANALNALGYTLADKTDRYQEAKELISKALELRPDDAHILDSMGWVLYRLGQFDQAIDYLQKAYESAVSVEVAAHLGEVFWESGETEKARQIWQQAYEEDQKNALLNDTLERYEVKFDKP